MGCFQSKKDSGDIHPNVFRVVNIDESGADLWSGQLEITETDLILYREGRDATVWPLASLRRYGFDGEIFSFESGRRCSTGEGIYAFRCRRAGMLFRTLQQNIQLRNLIQDTLPFHMPPNLSNGSPNPLPRQTLQASVVHRSSVDGGQPVRQTPSSITNMPSHVQLPPVPHTPTPRSPSGLDILEMTPLYPRTQNSGVQPVANIYQVKELKSKEHNNNHHTEHAESITDPQHSYCNDFNRDLAALRTGMEQVKALSTILDKEDAQFSAGMCLDYNVALAKSSAPLSPTLSNASEHYAQLSIEQREAARFMTMSPKSPNESDPNRSEGLPSTPLTPLTPRIPEYCNFGPTSQFEMNSYANLSAGEMVGTVNNLRQMLGSSASGEHPHKFSESDTLPSMSPVEELEVNYAVLELDAGKEARGARPDSRASSQHEGSSQGSARPRHVSQSSLEKAPGPAPPASVGYTTIDFEKTVALTSVADDADFDEDGCRKTRHSSTACSSPSSATDKNKN